MNSKTFEETSKEVLEWINDYLKKVENYPVKSQVKYHDIYEKLPETAPDRAENFNTILNDFKEIIMPGNNTLAESEFLCLLPC